MAELNRFIQFNNEQIDPRVMLHYEHLAKALANAPYLTITERQLIEMKPQEEQIAISVFWRHRNQETTHLGRLSDIYLVTCGFWKEFSVTTWLSFEEDLQDHELKKLYKQLVMLVEEFRLMDFVAKKRPGTKKAIEIRRKAYTDAHRHRFEVNSQKGFIADALINYLYLAAHDGMMSLPQSELAEKFEHVLYPFQQIYDVKSTKDSIDLIYRIMPYVAGQIPKDVTLNYYALMDSIPKAAKFHEHSGVKGQESGDQENKKETIEQLFQTWHRETKEESGVHLRFELERGNASKSLSLEAEEGQAGNEISEEGTGATPNTKATPQKSSLNEAKKLPHGRRQAGEDFGEQNRNVVFEEKRITQTKDMDDLTTLAIWRLEQAPSVKAITSEFRKRLAQKELAKRENLSKGRLDSSKLAKFLLEDRPKPFYKKNAPAKPLNAVFGLLIDGSASMIDKMDETKKAVLLFHDVLRQMNIPHEMVSFYEDAYEATPNVQPNTFEWLHKLEDGNRDDGPAIMSLTAHEDNRDGFAIRWMTKRLKFRDEKNRFILVFSDGEPSAFDYAQNGIKDTAEAVLEAKKQNIQVIHLFLNIEMPGEEQLQLFQMIYGNQTVAADSVEKFTDVTLRLLRKVISLVIQSQ
ncbi:vWA domain-containing protein [Rummeliibacillus sp. JY-2-4R]